MRSRPCASTGVFHSLQGDLWCTSNQTRRGLGAFGTATGTVGGVDVGTAEFAEIFSGVMKFNDSPPLSGVPSGGLEALRTAQAASNRPGVASGI